MLRGRRLWLMGGLRRVRGGFRGGSCGGGFVQNLLIVSCLII
jgi:hypothetical protein